MKRFGVFWRGLRTTKFYLATTIVTQVWQNGANQGKVRQSNVDS